MKCQFVSASWTRVKFSDFAAVGVSVGGWIVVPGHANVHGPPPPCVSAMAIICPGTPPEIVLEVTFPVRVIENTEQVEALNVGVAEKLSVQTEPEIAEVSASTMSGIEITGPPPPVRVTS